MSIVEVADGDADGDSDGGDALASHCSKKDSSSAPQNLAPIPCQNIMDLEEPEALLMGASSHQPFRMIILLNRLFLYTHGHKQPHPHWPILLKSCNPTEIYQGIPGLPCGDGNLGSWISLSMWR